MARLFALAGPSGVGKTTFLANLVGNGTSSFELIPRATLRAKRPGEQEDFDYNFLGRQAFLQRLYAGDFLHIEEWGGSLYGIETLAVRDALSGRQEALIMSGIYGAVALRRMFPEVVIVYMHTGLRRSLTDPSVLDPQSVEIQELRRRLRQKVDDGVLEVPDGRSSDDFIDTRLHRSLVELAFVNGLIRNGAKVFVLENLRDKLDETLKNFSKIVSIAHSG